MLKRLSAHLSKYLKILWTCLSANFLSLFMSILIALIFKKFSILVEFYFIFPKEHRRLNLKGFQCQIWTSVKRLWKYLSSKTNLSTFLQFSCSKFRLKLFQRPSSCKNCQIDEFGRSLRWVRGKKLFAEITIHKILEINSNFYVKYRSTVKDQFRFFNSFLLTLIKFSFWEEDWALGYNYMKS